MNKADEAAASNAAKTIMGEGPLTMAPATNLRATRATYFGLKEHPKEFKPESPAGIVFANLNVCYKENNNVSEGIMEDVIWGFAQAGIPRYLTWDGLLALGKFGYLTFTDEQRVLMIGTPAEAMWYRWTPKFYNLLLEQPDEGLELSQQAVKVNMDNVTK